MNRKQTWITHPELAVAAALLLAWSAGAATAEPQDPAPKPDRPASTAGTRPAQEQAGTAGKADRTFVLQAAAGGVKEVESGRIATERASHEDVKSFAQRMVDDHTKANAELKTLASSKGISISDEASLKTQHQKSLGKLQQLQGAAFDKAYMEEMVADHKKTVALFERQAKSGQDAELKAFAEKQLPTLREHLKMATDLRGKVGAKSS